MGIEDTDLTSEQADELINQAYAPTEPMADVSPEPVQTEPAQSELEKWKFSSGGKEVIPDSEDKLKQWASMGYNYSQRMNDFNKRFSTYEQIDSYAQENPEWWNFVQSQFQNRGAPEGTTPQPGIGDTKQSPQGESDPAMTKIQEELGAVRDFMKTWQDKELATKRQQEDQQLDSQIAKAKESYNDLDWQSMDDKGFTLEDRVLKHAQSIGVNDFSVAFKDFMYDDLMKRAETKGQESASKRLQENKKLGLLGETPEPLKKFEQKADPKKMSYDELEAFELKQLGLS